MLTWRPLLRLGVAFQAMLLLAVQLADGSGVHRCPEHDSGIGVVPVQAAAGVVRHGHHGGNDSHRHQGLCPCLGACHGTSMALAPAGAPPLAAAQVIATVLAPASPPLALRSRHPHLLPFALGPPPSA